MISRRILVLSSLAFAGAAFADVTPAPLFRDGAVIQRDTPAPVWGTSTKEGEKITVTLDGGAPLSTESHDGKWKIVLPATPTGGTHTLTISGDNKVVLKDVVFGEVWICSGQSNMEMMMDSAWPKHLDGWQEEIAASKNPKIRLFTVKKAVAGAALATASGQWQECAPETVAHFSAVGYYFGKNLQKSLGDVPVGLISTSWGGTPAESWTSREALEALDFMKPELAKYDAAKASYSARLAKFEADKPALMKAHEEAVAKAKSEKKKAPGAPRAPGDPETNAFTTPGGLRNAMLSPLIPYAIRGAIWYQGESNNGRAAQYRALFPAMIADWRKDWGRGDFPFLFVQIAPYNGMSPEIREAQFFTLTKTPATGMAVTLDVGEADNIHPTKKAPVGARLALAASALAYGEKIEYSGPLYAGATFTGNKALVAFTHTGAGLELKGDKPAGFEVAGADGKYVPGDATVEGDKVVVTASGVTEAKAVRYAWANVPVATLFNKDGLPASPFRSDVK